MLVEEEREKRAAVGVEIRGGKAAIALIDQSGQIRYRCEAKTLQGRPAGATLEPYLRAIDAVLTYAQTEEFIVQRIGVSIPGVLECGARRVQHMSLLPALKNFPLCEYLEARYRLPAILSCDVDAALLGEHQFGAGRGCQRVLFLSISAVVGVAFLSDGEPDQALLPYIGHVGHLSVAVSGPRCSCGKRGCVNALLSLEALQRMAQRALRKGEESGLAKRLQNHEYFSPQLLAEEAGRGDSVALQIAGEFGRWLGVALTKYIQLFQPNRVILAGDLVSENEYLLGIVRAGLCMKDMERGVEIVAACLGREAALIGSVLCQSSAVVVSNRLLSKSIHL